MSTTSEIDNRPLILAAGSLLDHDAPTLLRAAAAAGFDGVGLRVSGEHAVPGGRQADELRSMADDVGVAIHDVEVLRIDETWGRAGARPESADRLLEMTARIGAVAILVVSDLPDRTATVDAVAGLVEAASTLQLTVGLEYMAWTTPTTPADALAMADATGCRIVVDVLHHVRVGGGVEELRALVDAGHLGWVQLCDAATADIIDRLGFDREAVIHEARHGRLAPGHGALPLADLLSAIPPGVAVSVEVQSDELLTMDAVPRARLLATTARSLL